LQALIDWSYDLLPNVEQALFRRLAVFNGGFTLDAVAGILGVSALDMLDALTELLNKSLIYPLAESKAEPRFAMLQTIHEYALLKLEGNGESAALQRQHSDFYVALAEHALVGLGGPEQQRWIEQLELEHDNLRTAMRWSLADDGDLALRFAIALYRFWYNCGYAGEGLSFIEQALSQSIAQDPWRRMKAMSNAAGLAAELGNLDHAYALYQQSLQLSQQLDDRKSIATAFANLGTLAMERGEYDQARSYYVQSLALRRTLGDINLIARTLRHVGLVEMHQCRYAEAEALVRECLALQRGLGDLHEICISMNSIGGIAIYRGHYAVAQQMLAEALNIARENGDRRNIAVGLNSLAFAAYLTGDYASATTLHRESLTLRREIGYRVGVAESLEGIAMLAMQRDTTLAAQLWGAAERLRREIGAPTIPPDQAIFSPQIERLRQELGEAAFDQALHEGEAMSMDAAVNCALDQALASPPS
jgi:tetratricopeptide (TPR) repeat protein